MAPNLSLKQRLTALSLASSPPTSPTLSDSPRSPTFRRKPFNFNPPWVKRAQESTSNGGYGESEMVQEVLSKMIFQAGVDFE